MISTKAPFSGYVTDVAYVPGYYPFMAPAAIRYIASMHGVLSKPATAGYRYLELGCGFGETLLTLAAANPDAHFIGIDFLPEHVNHIRATAATAALDNVDVYCCDFADVPSNLAEFDFITMHGVWSWVSPELRQTILRLIEQNLAAHGLIQVSYNCLPGWSSLLPVRAMIHHFASAAEGNSIERGQAALRLVKRMRTADVPLFHDQPLAAELVDKLCSTDPRYIPHEYLNEHWRAFDAGEVIQSFEDAGFAYAGRLPFSRNHWQLIAPPAFVDQFVNQDARSCELRKDFHANTMFRWDIYARTAPRRVTPAQRAEQTSDLFFRVISDAKLPHVVSMSNREVALAGPPHDLMLEVMGERSWSLGSLLDHPRLADIPPETLVEAVDFAVALSLFQVEGGAFRDQATPQVFQQTDRIRPGELAVSLPYNARSLASATPTGRQVALASRYSRQGFVIGDLHAVMLDELIKGGRHALETRVAARMAQFGVHLKHHATDRDIDRGDAEEDAISTIVETFFSEVLPSLYRQGIVEAASPAVNH
jgi:SAM-dependent methyltransferase